MLYWPGLDNDIDNIVLSCSQCQDNLPSNVKEPLMNRPKPTRPFQELAADFCSYAGRNYLVLVDCHTDWPTVVPMGADTTAAKLITAMNELFCRTAAPDIFWSDGGPQFTSRQFHRFSERWGFRHCTSSPYYAQSNGKAEATVKSMKKIIRAAWNGRYLEEEMLCRALLQYRNTPSVKDGVSPAQKLYGHPIQDIIPAHDRSFDMTWQSNAEEAEDKAEAALEKATRYYNQNAHPFPDIREGTHVAIQDPRTKMWNTYGMVTYVGPHRKYYIKTKTGRVLVRNRRFIRRRIPASLPRSNRNATSSQTQSAHDQPLPSTSKPTPRRSTRQRKPTQRLVEDPLWN